MPTYEYECKGCGHEFHREQRITDNPVKKCPSCGAMKAKRLISLTSFVLKGDGWYNDLYASSGSKKKDEAEKSDTSADASSDASDKKPEKKAKKDAKDAPAKKKGKSTKAA